MWKELLSEERGNVAFFSFSLSVKHHTLFGKIEQDVAIHSLVSFLSPLSPFASNVLMLLAIVFLATALLVTAQSTAEPQPYCHPVHEKFSNNADYWLHGTPVLRSHWSFDYAELVRRQSMDYWNGWKNISYLFALYVPAQEADPVSAL